MHLCRPLHLSRINSLLQMMFFEPKKGPEAHAPGPFYVWRVGQALVLTEPFINSSNDA